MNLNKVFLAGNLTRDPELRQTTTGQSVTTFGMATNSFYTDKSGQRQKKAEFHTVVAWGKQAELVSRFLKKGSLALVEGRLQTRSWEDKQGQKRQTTEVVCDKIQFGPRPGGSGTGVGGSIDREMPPEAFTDNAKEEVLPEINIEEGDIKADDIPF